MTTELDDKIKIARKKLEALESEKSAIKRRLHEHPMEPYAYRVLCIPSSTLYHKPHMVSWFRSLADLELALKKRNRGLNLVLGRQIRGLVIKDTISDFIRSKTGHGLFWTYTISIDSWNNYEGEIDWEILPDDFPFTTGFEGARYPSELKNAVTEWVITMNK